jgi:hypothetical protein
MVCHHLVEVSLVSCSEEAAETAKNMYVVVMILEHRHDGFPEVVEGFVVVITGETVEQVLVVLLCD